MPRGSRRRRCIRNPPLSLPASCAFSCAADAAVPISSEIGRVGLRYRVEVLLEKILVVFRTDGFDHRQVHPEPALLHRQRSVEGVGILYLRNSRYALSIGADR